MEVHILKYLVTTYTVRSQVSDLTSDTSSGCSSQSSFSQFSNNLQGHIGRKFLPDDFWDYETHRPPILLIATYPTNDQIFSLFLLHKVSG